MTHGDYVALTYRKLFDIPFRNREATQLGYGLPIPKLNPTNTYTGRWLSALITEEELLLVKEKYDLEMKSVSPRDNNEVVRGLKVERLWLRQEGIVYDLAKKHAEEAKAERECRAFKQRVKQRKEAELARQRIKERASKGLAKPAAFRLLRRIKDEEGKAPGEPQPPVRTLRAASASWRTAAAVGGPGMGRSKRPAGELEDEVVELSDLGRVAKGLMERHERKVRRVDAMATHEAIKIE